MKEIAGKWVGYLEHQTCDLLGVYTANVGKGGWTIFSEIIRKHYPRRNFCELPWCAVFVHAVCLEAYGKEKAKELLGKPHPGTRVLYRQMRRKGCIRNRGYIPKANDLIFLHNGDGEIGHVGIVERVDRDTIFSIEGNTVDPSGRFRRNDGGAVARRTRYLTDPSIVCYAELNLEEHI